MNLSPDARRALGAGIAVIALIVFSRFSPSLSSLSQTAALGSVTSPAFPAGAVVSIFGQRDITQTAGGAITASRFFHPGGIAVDYASSTYRYPIIYVADVLNNRILAFVGMGAKDTEKSADKVFGQPNFNLGACNGDNNLGMKKKPTASTLCLINMPFNPNFGEYWRRKTLDTDTEGNLYIVDAFNNRVLKYNKPFGSRIAGGGDTVADYVWGQPNFTSNNGNIIPLPPANGTLQMSTLSQSDDGFFNRGSVSVSPQGDAVWIADIGHSRVLRFPRQSNGHESAGADVAIGQSSMMRDEKICNKDAVLNGTARLDRLCGPTHAKVSPVTGELFVVDQHDARVSRILIFTPPFTTGQSARASVVVVHPFVRPHDARRPSWSKEDLIWQSESAILDFTFNAYKTGEYAAGDIWISDNASRLALLDVDVAPGVNGLINPRIIKTIGSIDAEHVGDNPQDYSRCGNDIIDGISRQWSVAIDSAGRIYAADELLHRVAMYDLSRYRVAGSPPCLPEADGELSGTRTTYTNSEYNAVDSIGLRGAVGVAVFGNQLIAKDQYRYLFWDNYSSSANGRGGVPGKIAGRTDDDVFTRGPYSLGGWSFHAIDDKNRLWTTGDSGTLAAFQLPLTERVAPLAYGVRVFLGDRKPENDARLNITVAVAFDPINKRLWVSDRDHHRLLGIRNYSTSNTALIADVVLGQPSKDSAKCNWSQDMGEGNNYGRNAPGPARQNGFCMPNQIVFDKLGNLYVVENSYEAQGNQRIVMFTTETMRGIETQADTLVAGAVLYATPNASKVFGQSSFTENKSIGIRQSDLTRPLTAVAVAFNSKNQMVVGGDGYWSLSENRQLRQLFFYNNPLEKDASGNYVQNQQPDAHVLLPIGAVGEMVFDKDDNLIVQDHIFKRILMFNYFSHPQWLSPIRSIPSVSIFSLSDTANFVPDQTYQIRWGLYWPNWNSSGGSVTLKLIKPSGEQVDVIRSGSIAVNKAYTPFVTEWRVSNTIPAGTYRIQLSFKPAGVNTQYTDFKTITIGQPVADSSTLKFTSPVNGQRISAGATVPIEWRQSAEMTDGVLELVVGSTTQTLQQISTGTRTGSHGWEVPMNQTSGEAELRVRGRIQTAEVSASTKVIIDGYVAPRITLLDARSLIETEGTSHWARKGDLLVDFQLVIYPGSRDVYIEMIPNQQGIHEGIQVRAVNEESGWSTTALRYTYLASSAGFQGRYNVSAGTAGVFYVGVAFDPTLFPDGPYKILLENINISGSPLNPTEPFAAPRITLQNGRSVPARRPLSYTISDLNGGIDLEDGKEAQVSVAFRLKITTSNAEKDQIVNLQPASFVHARLRNLTTGWTVTNYRTDISKEITLTNEGGFETGGVYGQYLIPKGTTREFDVGIGFRTSALPPGVYEIELMDMIVSGITYPITGQKVGPIGPIVGDPVYVMPEVNIGAGRASHRVYMKFRSGLGNIQSLKLISPSSACLPITLDVKTEKKPRCTAKEYTPGSECYIYFQKQNQPQRCIMQIDFMRGPKNGSQEVESHFYESYLPTGALATKAEQIREISAEEAAGAYPKQKSSVFDAFLGIFKLFTR